MTQRGISRRAFVQAAAVGGVFAAGGLSCRPKGPPSKPNILFIMADDLGYADVSCYGQRDYVTPNIDRVANQGLRFTQGYSSSAVCSSTRTALITGRYAQRLAVGLEEPVIALTPRHIGLPADHPTLPSLAKKAGYTTSLIGKWHLGTLPSFSPLKSGYDKFFGIIHGASDYFDHGPGCETRHPEGGQLHEQEVPVDRHGYLTDLLGERAVETLKGYGKSKEPFLMSLHYTAPHWPWEGPDDEAESKRIRSLFHHDGGTAKTYAQMVLSMDASIGKVLETLEVQGLAQNTIVVFTSDNGGERFSNTWPFSGMKNELLEGGVRVPTIIRWPARIAAGGVSSQVMISMDWMPTLLSAIGAQMDPAYPTDGEDLIGLMTGQGAVHPRKLFWRYKAGAQRAIRDGDMKYLRIAGNEFLFDVVQDPRERANLRERRRDVFDKLKAEWEAWEATMLPERTRPGTYANAGNEVADHYGVVNVRPDGGAPEGGVASDGGATAAVALDGGARH